MSGARARRHGTSGRDQSGGSRTESVLSRLVRRADDVGTGSGFSRAKERALTKGVRIGGAETGMLIRRVLTHGLTEIGYVTGCTRRCALEGCTGIRVDVLWADGRTTRPCTKGLVPYGRGKGNWRIK